jgi:hypothetical protein
MKKGINDLLGALNEQTAQPEEFMGEVQRLIKQLSNVIS